VEGEMPPVTTLTTPNEVVHAYRRAHTSKKLDSFWAGALTVVALSEMIGPLAGWPTISGLCFRLGELHDKPVEPWQMVLVILLQLIITTVAAYKWWLTCWPRWLAAFSKGSSSIVMPEANLREVVLGVFASLVVWGLITFQIYHFLPSPLVGADTLKMTELAVIALSAIALIISVLLTPKEHYAAVHPDKTVFERIPQSPVRVEVTFDHTNFEKSLLLKKTSQNYRLVDIQSVIAVHTGDHVLINLGVFEENIAQTVDVTSVNVFHATGRFSAGIHLPGPGEPDMLNQHGVDILIRNLYTKTDLFGLLKTRLSTIMNEYAGQFDSSVKSLVDDFKMVIARYESESSTESIKGMRGMSPLNSTATGEQQLQQIKARADLMLKHIESFRAEWGRARALHEQAKHEFPLLFSRRLTEGFQELVERDGNMRDSSETIARLMSWARIQFHVDAFEFVGAALEAESLINMAMQKATSDLEIAKAQLFADKRAREDGLRAILDGLLNKIDPRDLRSRQREIFHELMKIRTMMDISLHQEEIMWKINEFNSSDPQPTPTPLPFRPPQPLPPTTFNGEEPAEMEIRRVLAEQLKMLPAPLLRSNQAKRLIDVFVSRHKVSPTDQWLPAARGLVVQLSNIDFISDEPT
jgi:hypothetical protein